MLYIIPIKIWKHMSFKWQQSNSQTTLKNYFTSEKFLPLYTDPQWMRTPFRRVRRKTCRPASVGRTDQQRCICEQTIALLTMFTGEPVAPPQSDKLICNDASANKPSLYWQCLLENLSPRLSRTNWSATMHLRTNHRFTDNVLVENIQVKEVRMWHAS